VAVQTFTHKTGNIEWYCEQRGQGPHVVLIPSGEGDCANFEKTAAALADHFTVLTFDTPGFSRTTAPPDEIRIEKLADQIAALITSLGIKQTAVYGCSSGGAAVLDLVANHSDIITRAALHEAAIIDNPEAAKAMPMFSMLALDDPGIVAALKPFFANGFNEDTAAWEALGPEYHARLEKNYVTWLRNYIGHADPTRGFDPAKITQRPLTWTIGSLSHPEWLEGNMRLAAKAGVEIQLCPAAIFHRSVFLYD